MSLRINLGCGALPLQGYLNVDAFDDHADVRADVMVWEPPQKVEEVRMDHLLEHLPIKDGPQLVYRSAGWLVPGGVLRVEVPDMEEMMANPGPNWLTDVYGVQCHEGEFHRSGYTRDSLLDLVAQVGLRPTSALRFRSTNPVRQGFPCLSVVAVKP